MASGDSLLIFRPQDNEAPAATFATLDANNAHPVLDFAIDESAVFTGVLPRSYAGTTGITITLVYAMSAATANDVKLETSIERMPDGLDIGGDSFAAAQDTGDVTVPGAVDTLDSLTSTHTDGAQMDSLAAGEPFRVKVVRIAVGGTDATGDLELLTIEIKET